jgi:hypothetical protein
LKLSEDGIGGGGLGKGAAVEVMVDDVLVDLVDQFAHAPKRAAPDGVLGDEPEPALNLVEPTGVGRV